MSESIPTLAELRTRIEEIDRGIIALIDERVRCARVVGRAKRAEGLPILDPSREAAVIRRAVEIARDYNLDEEDIREIYWHLIGLSRRAQLAGHAETAQA